MEETKRKKTIPVTKKKTKGRRDMYQTISVNRKDDANQKGTKQIHTYGYAYLKLVTSMI